MIFRRDLRMHDNTAFNHAQEQSETVIACFIADPRQIGPKNSYKSDAALTFMSEALHDLATELKKNNGRLCIVYGKAPEVIKKLIVQEKIDAIFVNEDYTPFSRDRDTAIARICAQHDVVFNQYADELLTHPDEIFSKKGTPYTVFSAFFKKAQQVAVKTPRTRHIHNVQNTPIALAEKLEEICHKIAPHIPTQPQLHGTRKAAIAILHNSAQYKNYAHEHDIPSLHGTTQLSAYLKFGIVSVRECYHAIMETLGSNHPLIRQLYWRDFFTHIAYHRPDVFGSAYHVQYNALPWSSNTAHFTAWCQGNTGFPIVDAGMRQLNATGWMHNRVRMITASFLVKDLHINWQQGEQYFAQKLIDYDPSVNNGNWQWVASTGCDAQPYFRIFNPWLQQKKFDPDCLYIKQWIPELREVPIKTIHSWFNTKHAPLNNYPRPLIEHSVEAKKALRLYKQIQAYRDGRRG